MTEKDYNECVRNYSDNVYRFIFKNLRHEEDAQGCSTDRLLKNSGAAGRM